MMDVPAAVTKCYRCLAAALLLFSGAACARVDFEAQQKKYEINNAYRSGEAMLPALTVRKPETGIVGKLYIDNAFTSKQGDSFQVEITKKRSMYKASTPIFEALGKRATFGVSIERGREMWAGLDFHFDLNLP